MFSALASTEMKTRLLRAKEAGEERDAYAVAVAALAAASAV
jgi:hypothetical protein